MADTSVQPSITPIDPMFSIPDGVKELEYTEASPPLKTVTQTNDEYSSAVVEPAASFDTSPIYNSEIVVLETPDIQQIVSQTIRRAPNGFNVIDVVVDVTDIPGADKYEFRVTKL